MCVALLYVLMKRANNPLTSERGDRNDDDGRAGVEYG